MDPKVEKKIRDFLLSKLNPSYLIVFGSYAKNTMHQNSDLDIAFYNQETTFSPYEIFLIAQELADILKMDVDLVDLRSASTVFKVQIYTTGIVIFAKDEILLKNQQMTALSMYAKLNEEREVILTKIQESGAIYEK